MQVNGVNIYVVRGEDVPCDEIDDVAIDAGPITGAWWEVPLPRCPDCGGDLVWYEAGYVPGTRKCLGVPIGGRPTNPMLDARVPFPIFSQSGKWEDYRGHGRARHGLHGQVCAMIAERNTCSEERIEEIDRAIIALLYPDCRLEYDDDGGCGSFFTVATENR